ncbi:hypothetical protein EI94DRAFT_1744157 [Lactarius quietus]|nr:hypothetical protein EI94DRAFT_1744157 [Lactarius quietus]
MYSSTSHAHPNNPFRDHASLRNSDTPSRASRTQPVPALKAHNPFRKRGQSTSGRNEKTSFMTFANGTTRQDNANAQPPILDLAMAVKGMYRLLDLITESGSNGYVDKVIIARESLERFINTMCPGAYTSIAKVDFKALDRLMIKPLGVYGSKYEIARLLLSIGAVNDEIARLLLQPTEIGGNKPALSSGLYVVTASPSVSVDERHYVIYWPEDSTWNDSAPSSVFRNRVTFMRYLTKICDQVVALLSAEQSQSLVWNDEDNDIGSVDVNESDRLFIFGVEKTNEQQEGAVSRPGFQMNSLHISRYAAPNVCSMDPSIFVPRLLRGETAQGFLTASYIQRQIRSDTLCQRQVTKIHLTTMLNENTVVLSEGLNEKAIDILIELAFWKMFPGVCRMWRATQKDICERFKKEVAERSDAVCNDLLHAEVSLRRALRESVVDDVLKLFPSIGRDSLTTGLRPDGESNATCDMTEHLRVNDLRRLYPGFYTIYQRHLENKFDSVKGSDFRFLKERLLLVRHLIGKNPDLDPEKRAKLIQTLLSEDNLYEAQKILPNSDKKKGSGLVAIASHVYKAFSGGQSGAESEEDSLRREMKKIASAISDSEFLLGLKNVEIEGLQSAIQEAELLANTSLSSSIDTTVTKMTHDVLKQQQVSCKRESQKAIQTKESTALSDALVKFIRDLNAKSAGRKNPVLRLDNVELGGKQYYSSPDYKVSGVIETPEEPQLEFRVHLMDLSSEDRHNLLSQSGCQPHPTVNNNLSSQFYLPIGVDIV